MTRTQMLLTIVAEECNETAQRASKAIRFGLDEVQEGQDLTNAERLCYEFNDILAVIDMLRNEGLLNKTIDPEAINLKKAKVEKWLQHSISQGMLID